MSAQTTEMKAPFKKQLLYTAVQSMMQMLARQSQWTVCWRSEKIKGGSAKNRKIKNWGGKEHLGIEHRRLNADMECWRLDREEHMEKDKGDCVQR